MEHTKEPWKTAYRRRPSNEMMYQEIFDSNGKTIAILTWYPVKIDEYTTATNREENARRIVACVNACVGISTEDLERGYISIRQGHVPHGNGSSVFRASGPSIDLSPDRNPLETLD